MASEHSSPDQLQSERPIEFRSTSEEVAVGTVMGGLHGSFGALILGGILGATGASIGDLIGWRSLIGSVTIWLALWVLPLLALMTMRPLWRFLALAAWGAAYLALLQWHIGQRDIGTFYPWSLSALPFGIVLGIFFEPLRLARGGSTEDYAARGLTIGCGIVAYGNRNAMFLSIGFVLGFVGDLFSLGRQRIGAPIGGFLGGGLTALAFASLVAWRGDISVADLFFGSVWNIAWAGTAIGATSGAISGWWAGLIRERQEQCHLQMLHSDRAQPERVSSDNITDAKS